VIASGTSLTYKWQVSTDNGANFTDLSDGGVVSGATTATLNLFTFAMLVLVLADNLLLMFVGWEGVGFCSWALIGFW